jgi:endoglucanase
MNTINKKMGNCTTIGFLIAVLFFTGCKKKETVAPELTVSPSEINLPPLGGTADLTIDGNVKWSVDNTVSWLQLNQTSGNTGSTIVKVSAVANTTGATRSTELTVSSSDGQTRRVTVSQSNRLYPSYNFSPKAPDSTGMSTAVQLAVKINLGWNLGNTMEAPGGETGWGSPVITETYIKFIKQSGFNAIRIPCAWDFHVDNKGTAHMDPNWLNRVKEVVGYCVNNDIYVLLNIHWDGGWLDENCKLIKKDSVNAKVQAFWEQIGTTMRDFDEHLMFASCNEPTTNNAEEMGVLLSYHQTFVNTVRSTGGKNSYRSLVIQGSSDLISVSAFPTDPAPNRLMYEEHNYTPFQFTLMDGDASWGKMFYYWGAGHHSTIEPERNPTWGEESEQIKWFDKMKSMFIDKNIPVLMGEYGAYRRGGSGNIPKDLTTHNDAVDYWLTYVTKQATIRGIKAFFWDTGGALDRQNNTVKDQRTIDAIIAGSK